MRQAYWHIPPPLGMNTKIDPFQLGEEYAIDMVNYRPHKALGRLEPVLGRATYNATELTATSGVYNLFEFIRLDGTKYLVLSTGDGKIYGSTTSTFGTAWISGLPSSVGASFAGYKNLLYIGTAYDNIRATDGTIAGSRTIEIAIPTSAPTLASAFGSPTGLSKGTYKWAVAYEYDGYIRSKRGPASTAITVTDTEQYSQLISLPISTNSRVANKYILRTVANGEIFYKVAGIPNAQEEYLDVTPDSLLKPYPTEQFNMPKAKFIFFLNDRLWAFNVKTRDVSQVTANMGAVSSFESGGGLTAGATYRYTVKLVSHTGIHSTVASASVDVIMGAGPPAHNIVTLSNLPYSDDPDILARDIYRSEGNQVIQKFLVRIFDNETTTYKDRTFDIYLGAEAVATPAITDQSKFWWSNLQEPDVTSATNFDFVNRDDGQEITGVVNQGGNIIAFKQNSIYRITTTSDSDNPIGAILPISQVIGCVAPNSIITVEDTIFFLSQQGFFALTGNELKYLSEDIEPDIYSLISNLTNRTLVACAFYPRYREIWMVDAVNKIRWIYNLTTNKWSKIKFSNITDNDIRSIIRASDGTLYSGGFDRGYVFKEDNGNKVYLGSTWWAIQTSVDFRWLSMGAPIHEKSIREIDIVTVASSAVGTGNNFTVKTHINRRTTPSQTLGFIVNKTTLQTVKFVPSTRNATWFRMQILTGEDSVADTTSTVLGADIKYRLSHPNRMLVEAI